MWVFVRIANQIKIILDTVNFTPPRVLSKVMYSLKFGLFEDKTLLLDKIQQKKYPSHTLISHKYIEKRTTFDI